MKKMMTGLIIVALSLVLMTQQAFAGIGTINVTNSYNKSSGNLTSYVKNSHDKQAKKVKLELQKNSKTVSTVTVTVKKDTQLKKVFKLSAKGKYRIKYTVDGKTAFTNNYNY